uniref:RING-type E3 ubiquitin transferase n=1 Tax=Apteryx owenii TaxID=8824 RepID=A0A8B9PN23_APTOW
EDEQPEEATSSAATCPICLDRPDNAVLMNPCLHQFCFSCMQRWSETKANDPHAPVGM